MVNGTTLDINKAVLPLKLWGRAVNDAGQAGGTCRFVTDSYRGPRVVLNWSLIYRSIACVSYLTVVQTQ